MPFYVDQTNAEMLDKGLFIIELWHKSTHEDELLGVTKLDLFPIIDSLRINEDTLSIIPISRNLQPIIIYDGNYPVYNYDTFSNIYYLDLTMAVGTIAQINNYIKKNKSQQKFLQTQYNSVYSEDRKNNFDQYEHIGTKKLYNSKSKTNITNNETLKKNYDNNYNKMHDYLCCDDQSIKQQKIPSINNNENMSNNIKLENSFSKKEKINTNMNNKYKNEINEDEIFEINNLMNNNKRLNQEKEGDFAKFDVEKFLENNRLELDNKNSINMNSNNNYLNPFSQNLKINKNQEKFNQYENPFIINTNTNTNNNTNLNLSELPPKSDNNKIYQISKESNFYIDNKDKDNFIHKDNNFKLNKLSDTEFFKSGKNLLKSLENNDINPELDNYHLKIDGGFIDETNKYNENKFQILINPEDNKTPINNQEFQSNQKEFNSVKDLNQINKPPVNNSNRSQIADKNKEENIVEPLLGLTRHSFDITIEKLINLQILNKINRPYLKYKFFNDSEYVKSDILYYTEYDKETSTIIVDMKTSHSNLLRNNDKIKDLLGDLEILFVYQKNEINKNFSENESEIVFGKATIPVDDIHELILNLDCNNNSNSRKSTIFIYGTDKINREDCIIGKLKMSIKYFKENLKGIQSENILYEKQVVYSRKIPKNSCLIIKLNYFKYNQNFLKAYDYDSRQNERNNYFYFDIDPFYDDKVLRKVFFLFLFI